jgi:hypothetical protein
MAKKTIMKNIGVILYSLLVIGGINWGLIGLFQWDLVQFICTLNGSVFVSNILQRVIYSLVGLSALTSLGVIPYLSE